MTAGRSLELRVQIIDIGEIPSAYRRRENETGERRGILGFLSPGPDGGFPGTGVTSNRLALSLWKRTNSSILNEPSHPDSPHDIDRLIPIRLRIDLGDERRSTPEDHSFDLEAEFPRSRVPGSHQAGGGAKAKFSPRERQPGSPAGRNRPVYRSPGFLDALSLVRLTCEGGDLGLGRSCCFAHRAAIASRGAEEGGRRGSCAKPGGR